MGNATWTENGFLTKMLFKVTLSSAAKTPQEVWKTSQLKVQTLIIRYIPFLAAQLLNINQTLISFTHKLQKLKLLEKILMVITAA